LLWSVTEAGHSYRYNVGYDDDPAYTSHSHGWSSGPTSALTFYLLGLTVTSTQGKTWTFAPHLNTGIPAAKGGFETPLGRFNATWSFDTDENGIDVFNARVSTPSNTVGTVKLPENMMGSLARDGNIRNFVLHGSSEIQVQGGSHNLSWKANLSMSLLLCYVAGYK